MAIRRPCAAGCGAEVAFEDPSYAGPGVKPLVLAARCSCGAEQKLLPAGVGPELHWLDRIG